LPRKESGQSQSTERGEEKNADSAHERGLVKKKTKPSSPQKHEKKCDRNWEKGKARRGKEVPRKATWFHVYLEKEKSKKSNEIEEEFFNG